LIETNEVTKRYGGSLGPALDRLSISVGCGEVLGLVGPNGAGKTTTVLMLAGLLKPSSGVLRVLGREVRAGLGDPRVGLVSGSLEDFDYLTGAESILLGGRLLGLSGAEAGRRTDALLKAFDLEGAENNLTTTYSSGMKQKVRICCALVGEPQVLLLDEPFEALDIHACAVLSGIVEQFTAAGGATLLCSHDLRMVERLATHYAILQAGQLQEMAPMKSLAAGAPGGAPARPALEQRFWEVTGAPPAPELDWLNPGGAGR
jgi:ABC-2 type transport system ATP-binding protein